MASARRFRWAAGAATLSLLALAGCATDDDASTTSSLGSPTITDSPSTRPALALDVDVTTDVRYHEDLPDLTPALLDVYAPSGPGPWPVVVAFHGGDGWVQTKATTEVMARRLAAEGLVVFAPSIGGTDDGVHSSPEKMRGILSEVPCALAFAGEHAHEYGGDADDVNVYGYSGGARAAGQAIWGGTSGGDGCLANVPPPAIRTAVLFEGDWLLSPNWDDALDTGGLALADATVWDDVDVDLDTEVVLVIGTDEQGPIHRIPVGDVFAEAECGGAGEGWAPEGGTCRYFDLRDPDGTLRETMAANGWLGDGFWDISEVSRLLVDRLEFAGHPPVVVEVDGLHHGSDPQVRADLVGPIVVEHAIR